MTDERLIELLAALMPIFEAHPGDFLTDVEIYEAVDSLTENKKEKNYLKRFFQKKAAEYGLPSYSVQ